MTPPFRPEDLAVVIPTRDHWDVLAQSLSALGAQSVRGFAVVIVVDGRDQAVPELDHPVRLVVKDHAGPGAARNAGVRSSSSPLVLLLGDDMIAAPDLIERHLDAHNRWPEPEVAVLGHVDWHPSVGRGRIQRWMEWSGTQFDFPVADGEEAGPGRFYSSNVSCKRSLFLDAEGFDEDYPFVYEDIDLGLRLAERGMRLLYQRRALTWHLHRYDPRSLEGRFKTVGTGERIFCQKHPHLQAYFHDRIATRRRVAPGSPWPWIVDRVPRSLPGLRRRAEERAGSWYLKRLAPAFSIGWAAGAELEELRSYLNGRFDYPRLVGRSGARTTDADPDTVLYEGTRRAMNGGYQHVVTSALRLAPPPARVLHYACGTGSVGLSLLDAGRRVTFLDVEGPASGFLAWRVERRRSDARVLCAESLPAQLSSSVNGEGRFDLAVATDVPEGRSAEVVAALSAVSATVAVGCGPANRLLVRRG